MKAFNSVSANLSSIVMRYLICYKLCHRRLERNSVRVPCLLTLRTKTQLPPSVLPLTWVRELPWRKWKGKVIRVAASALSRTSSVAESTASASNTVTAEVPVEVISIDDDDDTVGERSSSIDIDHFFGKIYERQHPNKPPGKMQKVRNCNSCT